MSLLHAIYPRKSGMKMLNSLPNYKGSTGVEINNLQYHLLCTPTKNRHK